MKFLQEFIDSKKIYYAYEYTLNYIYTLIRMYTGYRIKNKYFFLVEKKSIAKELIKYSNK